MILDEIAASARQRVKQAKRRVPARKMQAAALALDAATEFPFEKALARPGVSCICEVKKASPSKGVIAADFDYLAIAQAYEAAGADALSVLTEPFYFQGSDTYLRAIARHVAVPVLRKDFTVDAYQIYEAKMLGASAVLLICAILPAARLKQYIALAHRLGLSALVETHTPEEIHMALEANARIIGVNNRNLRDFTVDITLSARLRALVPKDVLFVAESGIRTPQDVAVLARCETNAVLIGETLMRSADKKAALTALRSGI